MNSITRLKYTVRILIIVLCACYAVLLLLLNIPSVQLRLATFVASELEKMMQTEVSIGRVDLGLFNRIIVEDILLKDQQGSEMLKASRLSANFEILPLFEKRLSINSVQLYGFTASLSKDTPESIPNYQFLIDALSPKDTIKEEMSLDLRINSILVRRGKVMYDVLSEPSTPGIFNASHLDVDNLAATISLKALRKDTLNASVRRFSFKEQSGLNFEKLVFQITANDKYLKIKDFSLKSERTTLNLNEAYVQYDSLKSLPLFNSDVTYQGEFEGKIYPIDFSPFLPSLSEMAEPMDLSIAFEGKGKELDFSHIHIQSKNYLQLAGSVNFKNWCGDQPMFLDGKLSKLIVSKEGLSYLIDNFQGNIPDMVGDLGYIDFYGEVNGYLNHLKMNALLDTDAGKMKADMMMQTDFSDKRTFSGRLSAQDLNMGIILSDEQKFGLTNFDLELKGLNTQGQYPESHVKGVISSFEFNGYQYENITLDGTSKNGGFSGRVSLDDVNGVVEVEGNVNMAQRVPVYNIHTSVRNLKPNELKLSDKYVDSDISLDLSANFMGNSMDNMTGYISLDSLVLNAPDGEGYFLDNLTMSAGKVGDEKELKIESSFMNAWICGDYSYQTLPVSISRMLQYYLPSLVTTPPLKHPNHFKFDIRVDNTELFEKIFYLPIKLHMPSTLKGFFNEEEERIRVEGTFPQFTYRETLYESGVLLCENPSESFDCRARASMLMNSGAMLNMSLNARAKNDSIKTVLNWGNNTDVTYGGKMETLTRFSKADTHSPFLRADVDIHPTQVVFNDTIWHIRPSHIAIDSGYVYIDDLLIEQQDNQHLRINGKITDKEEDSCQVELKNIHVAYILDILQFDDVSFDGMATGTVLLSNILETPSMQTHLDVKDFTMNKALLGDADITGHWDNELGGIRLDAMMVEEGLSSTHVTGYVSPKQKGLDLSIEADSTNLALISPYLEGIFSEMDARINGNIRLHGPFKFLDLEGGVRANFDAKLDVLNTYFQIKDDSIHVKSGEFAFNGIQIFDREGNSGFLNGYLRHNKLKNLTYFLDVDTDNLLVYDSDDPGNLSMYGRVYSIGNVQVRGGNNSMNIDVAMTTGRNTTFTYVSGITAEATSNQFITFVDKTPKRIQDMVETNLYHYSDALKIEKDDGPSMDLYINMMVETTPEAQMKVIMDPVSGDYISARGTGNLQVNFYNKGDFRMFGNYVIDQGVYKLSMQEVIRKDFALQSGGTITFSGDPYHANLDLQAVYTVNSVSLSDLSTDASLSQSTVKVNCLMNITGSLAEPAIRFDLDLPAVSEEDRELVRSATSTEEQMNTQIIYLLTIGKFYAYDYADNAYQSSNATSSLAFNTLSGQLNNMLSQWTENKNWNIGANLSTGQDGWSDVEAEAILSGRLLNNRLLINGNFGYRENVLANTNFIGDFEAVWLLTKNGDWRLRGYNQTNDRYFTKSTLTTQGVGLMYKKDFDDLRELFYWFSKKWKKEKSYNKYTE